MIPLEFFFCIIKYIDLINLKYFRFINKNIYILCKHYIVNYYEKILFRSSINYITYLSKCKFNFDLDINTLIEKSNDQYIFRIYLNKINRKNLLNITEYSFCKLIDKNLLDIYYDYICNFNNKTKLYLLLSPLLVNNFLKPLHLFSYDEPKYFISFYNVFLNGDIVTDFILEEINYIYKFRNFKITISNIINHLHKESVNVYYRINYNKWSEHFDKYSYKYYELLYHDCLIFDFIYHTNKTNNLFKKYRDDIMMSSKKDNMYQIKNDYELVKCRQYQLKCYDIEIQNKRYKYERYKCKRRRKYKHKYGLSKKNQLRGDFQQWKKDFIYDLY